MTAEEILNVKKSFAVIGATPNKERYGYEVFEILHTNGYQVFPINPKYTEIDGVTCYPSLTELKMPPDVVLTALAPANTEQLIDGVKALGIETIWMPPGCWSDEAVKRCQELQLNFIYDVPDARAEDYANAILREYKKFAGLPVEPVKEKLAFPTIRIFGPGCAACENMEKDVREKFLLFGRELNFLNTHNSFTT